MKFLVCIKQVPDTTEIRIDPKTNTLIRTGVPSIVNPFDAYALDAALRMKEESGGTVTVISMGPPQAEEILRSALAKGADEAYLVTDRAFGGSDTLATSCILAAAARKVGPFDLIFCGKQAIDGDTGQVGPELAEHLDFAQATCVREAHILNGKLNVLRQREGCEEHLEVQLPAVVTILKKEGHPGFETLRGRYAANRREIPQLGQAELQVEASRIGLTGSPTRVRRTFTPERHADCVQLSGQTAEETAKLLLEQLRRAQVI